MTSFCLNEWMAQNQTIIIVGPEGSGKHILFSKALETVR
jgi:hypothetical protein